MLWYLSSRQTDTGMTETSPVSYQTTLESPLQKRIETVGTILPHTRAKIVKPGTNEILPLGQKGELCVSGYLLQKGILLETLTQDTGKTRKKRTRSWSWMTMVDGGC
jgi:acyl-CoA synthetase (AMP-forming)/AMP-acid ligase II